MRLPPRFRAAIVVTAALFGLVVGSFGVAPASAQPRHAALVDQFPDPRGCLIASMATATNLLRERLGQPALTYYDVAAVYSTLVPHYQLDPSKYPQPWTVEPLAKKLGPFQATSTRGLDRALLESAIQSGAVPIVYLFQGAGEPTHAVVLIELNAHSAVYWDPWPGRGVVTLETPYLMARLDSWVTVIR